MTVCPFTYSLVVVFIRSVEANRYRNLCLGITGIYVTFYTSNAFHSRISNSDDVGAAVFPLTPRVRYVPQ